MIPLGFRWVGLATTRIAEDAELLKLASQSGCKGVLIGFESISQDTLNASHKHFHAAAEICRSGQKAARPRHRHPRLFRVRLRQRR